MRAWALVLALGGCGFSSSRTPNNGDAGNPPIDAPMQDSDIDAPVTVTNVCLGTFVKICVDVPDTGLTLMTQTIDTGSSPRCMAYTSMPQVTACVIAGQSINIPGNNTISVTGAKPLILFATASLTIGGKLDAASHRGGLSGPAANSRACATNFTNPTGGG